MSSSFLYTADFADILYQYGNGTVRIVYEFHLFIVPAVFDRKVYLDTGVGLQLLPLQGSFGKLFADGEVFLFQALFFHMLDVGFSKPRIPVEYGVGNLLHIKGFLSFDDIGGSAFDLHYLDGVVLEILPVFLRPPP